MSPEEGRRDNKSKYSDKNIDKNIGETIYLKNSSLLFRFQNILFTKKKKYSFILLRLKEDLPTIKSYINY